MNICFNYFGFLYSPAYPLGHRLGITVFWQPAVIQDHFLMPLLRRCLIITQWLILWFYTQRIYFSSLDILALTEQKDKLVLCLSYLSVPRYLWRRNRRFKRGKMRRYLQVKLKNYHVPVSLARFSQRIRYSLFNKRIFLTNNFIKSYKQVCYLNKIPMVLADRLLIPRSHKYYSKKKSPSVLLKSGKFINSLNLHLATSHTDLINRFMTGFYSKVKIKSYKSYYGPKRITKNRCIVFRKRSLYSIVFLKKFSLVIFRRNWMSLFLLRHRRFFSKIAYQRFARKLIPTRLKLTQLRFFWYLKICFETYFKQRIILNCTSLYNYYFQPGVITRFVARDRSLLNRYIEGIKKRRTLFITKFRQQAKDLNFRPEAPQTKNKFSYAQLVLFLGLPPMWRKFTNTYSLCSIVIVSSILKNIQMLSQWLYNMVALGQTRRLRSMRMRFFMLLSKVLRDYGVFGQHLRGFRIEVYGKTGKSQKTRMRFFGDNTGLRYYKLSFRMNYQAFDIPTYAGVLGIRFWLY